MFKQKQIDIDELEYVALLELRLAINNKLAVLDSAALAKLNAGERVIGFRLKKGRKTRRLSNELALVNTLAKIIDRDKLYTKKVIGIPAIEKLLLAQPNATKSKVALFLDNYVTTTVSDPTLEFVGV